MLDKCEQATQGYVSSSNSSSPNGSTNVSVENDGLSKEIQVFVHELRKERQPLLTNDEELDELVRKWFILKDICVIFFSLQDD